MRVLNVELHTAEEVLDLSQVAGHSVHKEFGYLVFGDLTSHHQLLTVLIACRSHLLLRAAELYGHRRLFNPSEALLVDKLSKPSL